VFTPCELERIPSSPMTIKFMSKASELAESKIREALTPLVTRLYHRTRKIFLRVGEIADITLRRKDGARPISGAFPTSAPVCHDAPSRRGAPAFPSFSQPHHAPTGSSAGQEGNFQRIEEMYHDPKLGTTLKCSSSQLAFCVKDSYNAHVKGIVSDAESKCLEEILCPRLLYFPTLLIGEQWSSPTKAKAKPPPHPSSSSGGTHRPKSTVLLHVEEDHHHHHHHHRQVDATHSERGEEERERGEESGRKGAIIGKHSPGSGDPPDPSSSSSSSSSSSATGTVTSQWVSLSAHHHHHPEDLRKRSLGGGTEVVEAAPVGKNPSPPPPPSPSPPSGGSGGGASSLVVVPLVPPPGSGGSSASSRNESIRSLSAWMPSAGLPSFEAEGCAQEEQVFVRLATSYFNEAKDRITRNILLKYQELCLIPL